MKVALLVFLGLGLLYAGFASYSELHLINLLRTPVSPREDPVIYDGHTFYSPTEKAIYEEDRKRTVLYPWAHFLEEWQALLILAAGAGFAGGLIRLLIDPQMGRVANPNSPFIGLFLGPCLLAFSAIFDALMLEGDSHLRPISVVVACLAAGIAWEYAWNYVTKIAQEKFRPKAPESGPTPR